MISVTSTSAHANLVLINQIGVLLMGPSGSGKSYISHQLVKLDPIKHQLISDDLVLLFLSPKNQDPQILLGTHPHHPDQLQPIDLLIDLGKNPEFLNLAKQHPLLSHIPYQINFYQFLVNSKTSLASL